MTRDCTISISLLSVKFNYFHWSTAAGESTSNRCRKFVYNY